MNNISYNEFYDLYRETLEKLALQEVCACLYYDLADNIELASNEDLISFVDGSYICELCGHGFNKEGK